MYLRVFCDFFVREIKHSQIFSSSADNVLGTYSHMTSCRKKQERGGAK